jgi:hypothetical protein
MLQKGLPHLSLIFKRPSCPAQPCPATVTASALCNLVASSKTQTPPPSHAVAPAQLQEGGSANLERLGKAFVAWQTEHEAGPTWGLRDVLAQWRRRGLVVREPDTDAYRFVHGKWT